MLGLGGVPGVVFFIGMLLLPETPRWLAGPGHADRAQAALARLRGRHVDIRAELALLRPDLKPEVCAMPESRLTHKAAMLPLIVGVGLAIFQQVTGINTVIYFAPVIFQAAGLSSASAAILATAGIGVVNVVMTMVAIWLVDRVGRRVLPADRARWHGGEPLPSRPGVPARQRCGARVADRHQPGRRRLVAAGWRCRRQTGHEAYRGWSG